MNISKVKKYGGSFFVNVTKLKDFKEGDEVIILELESGIKIIKVDENLLKKLGE